MSQPPRMLDHTKPRPYQVIKREAFLAIEPSEDPIAFSMALRGLTEAGLLEITLAALPTWTATIGYACQQQVLTLFWEQIRHLVRGECKTMLMPDGPPEDLTFGFAWYAPKPYDTADHVIQFQDRPFMVGGMIYRGPGCRFKPNPYKEHSWSTHT